jgi:hypothetical protein
MYIQITPEYPFVSTPNETLDIIKKAKSEQEALDANPMPEWGNGPDDLLLVRLNIRDAIRNLAKMGPNCVPDDDIQSRPQRDVPTGYVSSLLIQNGFNLKTSAFHTVAHGIVPGTRIVTLQGKGRAECYPEEYVEQIHTMLTRIVTPPPTGWKSAGDIVSERKVALGAINTFAECLEKYNPQLVGRFINAKGEVSYFISPEGIDLMIEENRRLSATRGYSLFKNVLSSNMCHAPLVEMAEKARKFHSAHPESARPFIAPNGTSREYIAALMIDHLEKTFAPDKKKNGRKPRDLSVGASAPDQLPCGK